MAAKDELGRRGEEVAARRLEASGLKVLDRNWRCGEGELDIVAWDPGEEQLVICEVKTRSGDGYGTPFEAVTQGKRRKQRRLAQLWLTEHRTPWVAIRFDVVGVRWPPGGPPEIQHLAAAF